MNLEQLQKTEAGMPVLNDVVDRLDRIIELLTLSESKRDGIKSIIDSTELRQEIDAVVDEHILSPQQRRTTS